jgi:4-hydroxy-3-polyprenylbenzoate decarboxylase
MIGGMTPADRRGGQNDMNSMRLVIGISGASGVIYGVRLLALLANRSDVETHLVVSRGARLIIAHEVEQTIDEIEALADVAYRPDDLAAPIASGSFSADGMVVVPCSIKTLSAVANSYAANLIRRAADVTLKERRPLVLVVRETPLHLGHLRLMARATQIGATILPPIPAFYGLPQTIDDLIDETLGRVLSHVGVENELYTRWGIEA